VPIDSNFLPLIAAALESSETLVAVLDMDRDPHPAGHFSALGDAFLRFLGHPQTALIGQPISFIALPGAPALAAILAAFARNEAYRGDLPCIQAAGGQKLLGLHLMPVQNPATRSRHFVLIGRDITARAREAAQARMVRGMLLKSFMATDAAQALIAPDQRIIMANACLDSMLGMPPGSLSGRPGVDQILPPYRQTVLDALAKPRKPDEIHHQNIELIAHDGAPVLVAARFVQFEDAEQHRFTMITFVPRPDDATLPQRLRVAGKLRFINLDAVQASLGARWAAVSARVLETAEFMIRRRLGPEDLLELTADHGFTICFAKGSEAEATEMAAAIAREITQHLIGSGVEQQSVDMSAVVSQLSMPADRPPDMARLARHMTEAETALREAPWPPPRLESVLSAGGSVATASLLTTPPPRAHGATQAYPESSLAGDLQALQCAIAAQTQQSLLLDAGFSTFLNRTSLNTYVEACAALPQELRERLYLVFSPLPRGTTLSLLQDIMRRLGRVCAGFGLRLEDLRPPDFDLSVCRPAVAVIDMRRFDCGESIPEDRLRRLTSLLHVYRVRILAANVDTMETSRRLHTMGVDWITLDQT
jgi:hypothetical protein